MAATVVATNSGGRDCKLIRAELVFGRTALKRIQLPTCLCRRITGEVVFTQYEEIFPVCGDVFSVTGLEVQQNGGFA